MFNFFKPKLTTEADFDVFHDMKFFETEMPVGEIVTHFMSWTYDEYAMTKRSLGYLIRLESLSFNAPLGDLIIAQKSALAERTAKDMLIWFRKLGLIKFDRQMERIRITEKGEQIRQYYVLKRGLRGTLHDRMNRFEAA